jgi:hypothetical protein
MVEDHARLLGDGSSSDCTDGVGVANLIGVGGNSHSSVLIVVAGGVAVVGQTSWNIVVARLVVGRLVGLFVGVGGGVGGESAGSIGWLGVVAAGLGGIYERA